MRGYNLFLLALLLLPIVSNAQYWFQYGARGGSESYFNSGAKVSIQTISTQSPQSGSMAFWVGEDLSNGAFLQSGYLIPNESGLYPSLCSASGCTAKEYIVKGEPEWFYEYFNSGTGAAFLGAVGPAGSAGNNGTTHTYGFYSSGDTWYFFMGNETVGSVNLGTNNSGDNGPVAFAEIANTTNSNTYAIPVVFSNLSAFKGGKFLTVPTGYSYIGYGVGSGSIIPNPYGVEEVDDKVNYFEAGSGLPQPQNGEQLWQLGFDLNVTSQYGNLSGVNQYLAYHNIMINAPSIVYLNQSLRAVFSRWTGYGSGSYSGTSPSHNITMFSNITEIADWNLQYLFNLTSPFGKVAGYGWHDANSTVEYAINISDIYTNDTARWNFENWSTGENRTSASIKLARPYSVHAIWQRQYLLNASSPFGIVNGTGWYGQNSTASIALSSLYHNTSSKERLAFYSWSNGNRSTSISITMNAPKTVSAIFRNQSLVHIIGLDAYGSAVEGTSFYLNSTPVNSTIFLFNNYTYSLPKVYYKGVALQINRTISIQGPSNLTFPLPIYNVQIKTTDVFGIPVNVPMSITFLNGTTEERYSGPGGSVSFADVPYGSASVSASYGGADINAQTSLGAVARITVVSIPDIAVFAIIIIAGFMIYFFASHRIRHYNPVPKQSK